MGRFKKGLFFGGLLGAGMMWMSTTKKGRETREQLLDHAAQVCVEVKSKVRESGAWENMTRNKYVSLVQEVVEKYAVQHQLPDSVKNMVTKLVSAQWRGLKRGKKKK